MLEDCALFTETVAASTLTFGFVVIEFSDHGEDVLERIFPKLLHSQISARSL